MGRLARWLAGHRGPGIDTLLDAGFVALDVETTGLDPVRDSLVSLAAVPFVGGHPGAAYSTLVNPGRPIPSLSTDIHGITDAMVASAPAPGTVAAELDAVLRDRVLAGHAIDFDLAVINRARRARGLRPLRNLALDTRLLTAVLHPGWRDLTLERIAQNHGVEVVDRHRAEGDALTAGRVLLALLPALERAGFRSLGELLWAQHQVRKTV